MNVHVESLAFSARAQEQGEVGGYPQAHGKGHKHPDITVKVLLNNEQGIGGERYTKQKVITDKKTGETE